MGTFKALLPSVSVVSVTVEDDSTLTIHEFLLGQLDKEPDYANSVVFVNDKEVSADEARFTLIKDGDVIYMGKKIVSGPCSDEDNPLSGGWDDDDEGG